MIFNELLGLDKLWKLARIGIEPARVKHIDVVSEDLRLIPPLERIAAEINGQCAAVFEMRDLGDDRRQTHRIVKELVDPVKAGGSARRLSRLRKNFEIKRRAHIY